MGFRIIRGDITHMKTQAIVSAASSGVKVGGGCEQDIYAAAGYEDLLAYRKANIGPRAEGTAFLTPGFGLPAEYIIHAVSPMYVDGEHHEEELLRTCYRRSLHLAEEKKIRSIAFPVLSAGFRGYPREEAIRVAVEEIRAFLFRREMEVFLVVSPHTGGEAPALLGSDLEAYFRRHYISPEDEAAFRGETPGPGAAAGFGDAMPYMMGNAAPMGFAARAAVPTPGSMKPGMPMPGSAMSEGALPGNALSGSTLSGKSAPGKTTPEKLRGERKRPGFFGGRKSKASESALMAAASYEETLCDQEADLEIPADTDFDETHESRLEERMQHLSDTFSEYLLYLIAEKKMQNAEVYHRAIVDKKVFSKIKNDPDHHPQKLTALCLCIGAKLNLDETKDLLARAGYALSPCDKTDVIFSYFIENGIYDMIELDIQLEEHGLPCIIS
ncbi:MAG: macro domain-containing protein [Lachnospiraceae bacterium]|nr:macro domain-containing protein [Lachnospiraceae bacterium]